MKYGCCIDIGNVDAAASLGFDFVDLTGTQLASLSMEEVSALASALEEQRIPCHGLHACVPPRVCLAGPAFDPGQVRAYFDALAARARLLHVAVVGIGSPRSRTLPEGYPIETADRQMQTSLRIACEALESSQVLLESLNLSETNYIVSIRDAHRLIQGLSLPNLGLVLDLYHFSICGDAPDLLTPEVMERVRYFHIADPCERRYPSGETDPAFTGMVRDILARGSCGHIALEALSTDWKRDAAAGLTYLKNH